MGADMLAAYERRCKGVEPSGDLLDPRRRMERNRPALARVLSQALSSASEAGISAIVSYLSSEHAIRMTAGERSVLAHLGGLRRGGATDNG